MIIFFEVLLLIGLLWSAFSYYFERSIESLKYLILQKRRGYEIRQYDPHLVAQTEVTGTYDQAGNLGFRILANYIFGNNIKDVNLSMASSTVGDRKAVAEKMAMTAPVISKIKPSEKISMTAPVIENKLENNTRIISFVMPSKYTPETLPKPNNAQVKIVSVPAKKVAVLQFSWIATAKRVEQKKFELLEFLKRDGEIAITPPQTARYNAPFNAPWMNKNEIQVEIK